MEPPTLVFPPAGRGGGGGLPVMHFPTPINDIPLPPAATPWADEPILPPPPPFKEEEEASCGDQEDAGPSDGGGGSTGGASQRRTWTLDEDHLLVNLIKSLGPHSWAKIAEHFEDRTSKQCHQR